ncbi:HEAT repeat domain-containing protein [Fodinibius salsisoli]|uniref:HEAT repeat domain-containing protein n=1 Tax=Fodinibius salsisoli TaxID=2820877 RepID=A0ABT3PR60_9BACT|nr:HEAT repeat domain-containing protein [Fodinibius salsisoli]MCW9708347.1 HEAT repeat domain-containing protein [Fodinibius salsisoli]
MIDEQHIELVTAYLDGSIKPDQQAQLNDLIDDGEIDALQLREMQNLYTELGQLPAEEPSAQMRDNFYGMLQEEKAKQPASKASWLTWINQLLTSRRVQQAGIAVGVFLIGLVFGNLFTPLQDYRQQMDQLSTEVSQMREVMMMSLLEARSPSDRLKAVNISSDLSSTDDRVIYALLKTLNNDPNVNVRLASIESLLRHAENPKARQGLVEAISRQQSPQIQVALADAMLALQETKSVDELRRLLQQQELDSTVRDKLQNTIAALNEA